MKKIRELVEAGLVEAMTEGEMTWLSILTTDWQVVADLAAADLVLWLPTRDGRFIASSLCRSATAATVHVEDVIGLYAPDARARKLQDAMDTRRTIAPPAVHWAGLYSTSASYVPVVRNGRCFAVISREANVSSATRQTSDQGWTVRVADILCGMISRGEYPDFDAPTNTGHGLPRVSDGVIYIDSEGVVQELSPNANSSMRRLGIDHELVGRSLAEDVAECITNSGRTPDEVLPLVLRARGSMRVDIEAAGETVTARSIPLLENGRRLGGILLTRNVTQMRRREQELMTKDATIREIHHRVKNNLQTVSALLRIQERRSDSSEVRDALKEAGRRVESIATIHDALSQDVREVVKFDEVAERILQMAVRVASTGQPIDLKVLGTFGQIGAEHASGLATVLAELISNAVEHAFGENGGTIWVTATREHEQLTITIEDNGKGMNQQDLEGGLGTQIVKAVVRGELQGSIRWAAREPEGTMVTLNFRPKLERDEPIDLDHNQ